MMSATMPPTELAATSKPKGTTTGTEQKTQDGSKNGSTPTSKLRKYVLLLATLVATVTYAAGFSPPGDVWQDTADGHLAGEPIIRDTHYRRYVVFFYCNAAAFAASVVVIVLALVLSSQDDKEAAEEGHSTTSSDGQGQLEKKNSWVAVWALQVVMVLDLLALMGAYAAGTCRDAVTKVFSSLLVGFVVVYLAVQMFVASCPAASCSGRCKSLRKYSCTAAGCLPEIIVKQEDDDPKAEERLRKVLMLLATFAVSITYVAGLSTPGGFWGSTGPGHRPGDAILKDRHGVRLAMFFVFNTTAFVASLLIVVVLLDRKFRSMNAYGFLVVALVSLIGAYTAGSCREIDTTVYVASLVGAVAVYIGLLLLVALAIGRYRLYQWLLLFKPLADWISQRIKKTEEKTEKEKAADKARSLVLLLATLAATITYQAGLVPPGGVWQENSDDGHHKAGDPILLTTNARRYKAFFYCNSISFVASLLAIILVQKKLLLRHHVLEAVMILDLFGLIGAYAAGSCRDVTTSIYAMALAGAVLVYVVIHVIFITLDQTPPGGNRKQDDVDEMEGTRKRLLLFAILAATITYQAGLTPPGGFLLGDQSGHHAGDPVLLHNFPRRYTAFFYCNSVSFMLSIALILLLVNPNLYRPAIRSHALSVCTAAGLFALMGAYAAGSTQHLKTSIYVFLLVAVILFVVLLLFLLFLYCGISCQGDDGSIRRSTSDATQQGRRTDTQQGDIDDDEANKKKKEKEKRIHAKRKYLMLLGILVASVTYHAGLEPPGGAWQTSSQGYEAGNPVLHDNRRLQYLAFFYSNSTSFIASIVVILLLLVPKELFKKQEKKESKEKKEERKWLFRTWLVVMNTTIVLDLLGLLGAYAAGSTRRWKTSVYVFVLVAAVLAYMAIHLVLSCCFSGKQGSQQSTQEDNQTIEHGSSALGHLATQGQDAAAAGLNGGPSIV